MRNIGGREPLRGDLGDFYDAIEQPRKIRGELPILKADEVRPYMEQVRERTLEVLDEIDLDSGDPLLAHGFIYEMLLAHEYQHNETMLQLLQMIESYEPVEVDRGPASEPVSDGPEMVARRGRARTRSGPARPARASPTTTSARATGSSSTPSRSTAPRSPTPPSSSTWPTPTPSRPCTGSATARAAGCAPRWAGPRRSIRPTP